MTEWTFRQESFRDQGNGSVGKCRYTSFLFIFVVIFCAPRTSAAFTLRFRSVIKWKLWIYYCSYSKILFIADKFKATISSNWKERRGLLSCIITLNSIIACVYVRAKTWEQCINSLFMGCSIWREVILICDFPGFFLSPKVNCRISVLNRSWSLLYPSLRVQFHKPSCHHYMLLTPVDAAWITWRETDRLQFILDRPSTTLLLSLLDRASSW